MKVLIANNIINPVDIVRLLKEKASLLMQLLIHFGGYRENGQLGTILKESRCDKKNKN